MRGSGLRGKCGFDEFREVLKEVAYGRMREAAGDLGDLHDTRFGYRQWFTVTSVGGKHHHALQFYVDLLLFKVKEERQFSVQGDWHQQLIMVKAEVLEKHQRIIEIMLKDYSANLSEICMAIELFVFGAPKLDSERNNVRICMLQLVPDLVLYRNHGDTIGRYVG